MNQFDLTLFVLQEIAGKPVAPSWGAWAGIATFVFLIVDRVFLRGRREQSLDSDLKKLCEDFDELRETVNVMDTHLDSLSTNVRDLTLEWRGVDGKNGWKSIVRSLRNDVNGIIRRNDRIDAITEHERNNLRKLGQEPRRERDTLDHNGGSEG